MPATTPEAKINELYQMDSENKRRLRDVEQRLAAVDNSIKRVEAGLLEVKSKVLDLSGFAKSDKAGLETKIKAIENIINDIINNMKRLAEKSEIVGLKELIDIYNPVKSQFITRTEVENLIEEKTDRK
jgi:DNA-binding FrmR family transcriptional regulator